MLVGVSCKRRRTNAAHHLQRTGIASEAGAQDYRVGERADESLGARTISIGDERGHAQVVLSQVAMQQRLQSGDEGHEQRATFSVGEALGGFREARWQRPLSPVSLKSVDCPSRPDPLSRPFYRHGTPKYGSPANRL